MLTKNAMTFQVLLNYFHSKVDAKLFRCLPSMEAEEILEASTTLSNPLNILEWPKKLISRTHYSWFIPLIKQEPLYRQMILLTVLPETHSSRLQRSLKIPSFQGTLAPAIQEYVLNEFYQSWKPQEPFPIECLPTTSLSPLLNLSKNEIVELIDFFALYDIVHSMRLIVDKTLLKKIHSSLSSKQQGFLRACASYKGKLNVPKIDFSKWDGQPETFNKILQTIGMMRLGKAICGQSRPFLWILTHTLDIGRGKIIENYYQETEIPGITALLEPQVLFILNHIKPKSAP